MSGADITLPSVPLLRARQLRSAHGGPFDLDVAAGGCAIVTGPSGAGKSVLLRLLADLDPGEGEVWLEGVSRLHWSGPQWRRQVVYQSAEPAWWDSAVAVHFDTPPDTGLLDALGLPARLMTQPVERLSTGERQRLALVRSLARAPRVLLLDEPTAALDADSVRRVESLLADRRAAGLALVVVSHAPEQVARLNGDVYRLEAGRLHPVAATAAGMPQAA